MKTEHTEKLGFLIGTGVFFQASELHIILNKTHHCEIMYIWLWSVLIKYIKIDPLALSYKRVNSTWVKDELARFYR